MLLINIYGWVNDPWDSWRSCLQRSPLPQIAFPCVKKRKIMRDAFMVVMGSA